MERLTEKFLGSINVKGRCFAVTEEQESKNIELSNKVLNKLFELENLEEEIGMELKDILCILRNDSTFIYNISSGKIEQTRICFWFSGYIFGNISNAKCYKPSDFNITWFTDKKKAKEALKIINDKK